jgi:hypothetical protein
VGINGLLSGMVASSHSFIGLSVSQIERSGPYVDPVSDTILHAELLIGLIGAVA